MNKQQQIEDKEKQIEEMAKVIDDRLIEARVWLGSMNRGKGYWIAQKLVEHYQPKLPEDSVILSREEYEKLKYTWITDSDAYKKGCKETAERDFYTIIKALEERKERVKAFYGIAESVGADIAIRTVKELAKQFGVEIKEL